MGTREYYEQMQRSGHLRHDLTDKPGLGAARCPRCNALINTDPGQDPWRMGSEIRSAIGVVGSITFGILSGVNGYNTVIPYLQNHMKGPKLLPFVIGLPLYSGASATFAVLPIIGSHFSPDALKRPSDPGTKQKINNFLQAFSILYRAFGIIQERLGKKS